MLVLTRRIGEHVTIGDDAMVFVQSVVGNRVRLAIEAPHKTRIWRGELSKRDACRSAVFAQGAETEAHLPAQGDIHG